MFTMQNAEGDEILFEPNGGGDTWDLELHDPSKPGTGFYVTLTKQEVHDMLAGIQLLVDDWSL